CLPLALRMGSRPAAVGLRRSIYPPGARFCVNDTAPTEIYTLSLHDALPICPRLRSRSFPGPAAASPPPGSPRRSAPVRSEEHTSELQSHLNLVCRLLLE